MEPSRPAAPHSFAACSRVFFRPDVFSEMMGRLSRSEAASPVRQHAKPCKPKLSRLGGLAKSGATSVRWRTSREFCHRERSSVTDMLATQLSFSQPVSERAALKSIPIQTRRAPYNKLVEGTPPRCALRRPSPARYTSAG